MSFHPNPYPEPHGMISLTPILETSSAFVPPSPIPLSTSPLRQLRAPPIPFVPHHPTDKPLNLYQIPLGFYLPPSDAPAIFSTKYNYRPKRRLYAPFPAPVIRSNFEEDVEARARQIIKEFPQSQSIVNEPPDWWDLHEYFDGYDLWVEGASFCFQVMLAICRKNKILHYQLGEMNTFARNWIEANRDAVLHNAEINPVTELFTPEERMTQIHGLSENEMLFLNDRLAFYRQICLQTNATQQQLVDPRYQTTSPHGHPAFPAVPSMSVNQLGRSPTVAPILPQVDRARHDPGFPMAHRPVNDQHSMARGSSQGEDPSSFSLQFTELMVLGRQDQGHGSIVDTRRELAPTSYQNQANSRALNNVQEMMPPQGISNSSQSGRGRDFSQNPLNSQGQRHVPDATRGSPSSIMPSREPVYVRNISPQHHNYISIGNRVVSAPTPSVPFHPASRTTSGGQPQIMSPTNREQISRNTQATFTSPKDPRTSSNFRQYVPTFAQGPALLSSSPTSRMTQSNDARVNIAPVKTYPRVDKHENTGSNTTTWTIHYRDGPRDFEGARTCMVRGLDDKIVFSHQLKRMMESCGLVTSVHYLEMLPRAFVLFSDSSSVERAVAAFNHKTLPSGHKLFVSKTYPARSRSGSNASQNYGIGIPTGDFEARSRRPSIRNSSNGFNKNPHSRHSSNVQNTANPSGHFMDQGQSSLAEVIQHHSAPGHQVPLSSVENIHNASKQRVTSPTKSQQDISTTGNGAQKENVSPVKRAGAYNNGENMSQRKGIGSGKKTYKGYKASRQNTSNRPTPAVTPVKSMSAADLQDISILQIATDMSKMSNSKGGQPQQSTADKDAFKPKGIQGYTKSDVPQFTDNASDTTLSPVESAPMTRDTSFSAGSSRKHSRVESSQLTRSQSSLEISSMGPEAAAFKKKAKKPKYRGHKQDDVTKSEQTNIRGEEPVGASSDTRTQKLVELNHSKKGSNASIASNSSMRKADAPPSKTEKDSTILTTAKTITGDVTEAAALPTLLIASTAEFCTGSPKKGESEWPSLGESSTPSPDANPSSPPVVGPSSTINYGKKSVKPVVPAVAVPRAFETQSRP